MQTITLSEAWKIAIALQQANQFFVSSELRELAQKHIDGQTTLDSIESRLSGADQADRVAARIVRLLTEDAFTFAPAVLTVIHRRLFSGIRPFAGAYRDYDVSDTIYWQFSQEQAFSYHSVTTDAAIEHLASMLDGIYAANPFREGNRRTMLLFSIVYLRELGFELKLENFALPVGVSFGAEYMSTFFRSILLGEKPRSTAEVVADMRREEAEAKVRRRRSPIGKTARSVIEALRVNPMASARVLGERLGKSTRAI